MQPIAINQEPEQPFVTAHKIAALNVLNGLAQLIQDEAITLLVAEAEATGEPDTGIVNPFRRDEITRQLMATIAGILSQKILAPHQMQDEYFIHALEIEKENL